MTYDVSKLAAKHSYLEGASKLLGEGLERVAIDYKRRVTSSFVSISGGDISSKIHGEGYTVTRKIDGELQGLVYDGNVAITISTTGCARASLPCIAEAASLLAASGKRDCTFAAELHVDKPGQRGRVYDVSAALGEKGDAGSLGLAVFDIIAIEGKPFQGSYTEALALIDQIFAKGTLVTPIPRATGSAADVARLYDEWVVKECAEGLVVRSELPISYKIKQLLSLDLVVTGYSLRDDRAGLREVQLSCIDADGNYRVVGVTGNGLSDKDRVDLFALLLPLNTVSEHIAVDSRRIAFQPVRPEIVVEITCNDLLTDTVKGPVTNPAMVWGEEGYTSRAPVSGVSMLHPVFVRLRPDKMAQASDAGLSQITAIVELEPARSGMGGELKKSEIIFREVYGKKGKDGDMVQKFLAWKTNKEKDDQRYPAYVFHYTNYSPSRSEPLKREIRVSSSAGQIMAFAKAYVEENVKKGWEKC